MCINWYLSGVKALGQGGTVHLLEELVGLGGLAGHPVADDGVHRVVGAAAVHADPLDFLGLGPLGELAVGAGMLDHVADLVGVGLIPAKVMVTCVDDEDVALADVNPLLDHRRGVDLVVAGRVGEVHDHARPDEKVVEVQLGDVLAGGEEMDLAVQVGPQVVGVAE